MFYDALENSHGLKHDPFKALVSPRPIGWVGSRGLDGSANLAPYSFFNAIGEDPKMVMFASTGKKDSLRNCSETGQFSLNMVGMAQVQAMSDSSAVLDYGENEFEFAKLDQGECALIDAPYVVGAFARLECRVTDIFQPKTLDGVHSSSNIVIGQVVGIYIDDKLVLDGLVDITKVQPVARLGYRDYSCVKDVFCVNRPEQS